MAHNASALLPNTSGVQPYHNISASRHSATVTDAWRSTVAHSGSYTKEQINAAFVFYTVAYFCLLILATLGNTLNLAVLLRSRDKWSTATWCYMLATAVSDLVVLWTAFPNMLWNVSFLFKLPFYTPANRDVVFASRAPLLWSQETCMRLSDWIVVAFSLERLLVFVNPFRFNFVQRAATARVVIVVLLILSLLSTMFTFASYFVYQRDNLWTKPHKAPTWLLQWSRLQDPAEDGISLLTFSLILTINLSLLVFLSRQRQSPLNRDRIRLRTISNSSSQRTQILNATDSSSLQQRLRLTVSRRTAALSDRELSGRSARYSNAILLSNAALYLVTRLPVVVHHCLLHADRSQQFDYDPSAQRFAAPFVNVPQYMGHSCQFFLYLATNRMYRQRFIKLFVTPLCPDSGTGWRSRFIGFFKSNAAARCESSSV